MGSLYYQCTECGNRLPSYLGPGVTHCNLCLSTALLLKRDLTPDEEVEPPTGDEKPQPTNYRGNRREFL